MNQYSNLTKKQKVERFLKAVEKAFGGMGNTQFWPVQPAQIEPYFCDILAVSVFEKFKEDKKKFRAALEKVEPELLKIFLFSGGGIIGLKVARHFGGYKISASELEDYIVSILDCMAKGRKGDEFSLDGTNRVFSGTEIKRVMAENGWVEVRKNEIKQLIAELSVTTESLTWTLFYDLYRTLGMIIHGPYQTRKGVLLCRDFPILNPPFWPVGNKHPRLKIYLLYEKGTKISVDFVNHQFYPTPIIRKLKAHLIITSKSLKAPEEILNLEKYYSRLRDRQAKRVENLSPQQKILKGAEIHYYMLKEFFEFYGQGFKPPEAIGNRIRSWGLKYWEEFEKPPLQEEDKGKWARRAYDPEIEFF